MATVAELQAEIEALKAELAELSEAQGGGGADDGEDRNAREQLREVASEVSELLQTAEQTIKQHPVPSAFAALALGLLIGRGFGR